MQSRHCYQNYSTEQVPKGTSVRLLGITVSGLVHVQAASRVAHQMSLLDGILNPR